MLLPNEMRLITAKITPSCTEKKSFSFMVWYRHLIKTLLDLQLYVWFGVSLKGIKANWQLIQLFHVKLDLWLANNLPSLNNFLYFSPILIVGNPRKSTPVSPIETVETPVSSVRRDLCRGEGILIGIKES